MSAPAPLTVNTPPDEDADPGNPTEPMSWLTHGVGSGDPAESDACASISTQTHVAHTPWRAAFRIVMYLKKEELGDQRSSLIGRGNRKRSARTSRADP